MDRSLKTIFASVALTICLVCLAPSHAKAWEYSVGEEDWGTTCFVKHPHSRGEITLMSGKGNFNPVVLISLPKYPRDTQNLSARFVMDQGYEFSLTGNVDDYFGVIYLSISSVQIDALVAQNRLTVQVSGVPNIPVSLKGSGDAIRQFLSCAQKPSAGGAGGSGAS